ncbi:hypothetical protein [Aquibacillus saliphilus]|uniref:hypothetical protein n=1 Tax=Aquibacillus saliphilus TaxID=1909422 RepID=UPI001CEFFE3F|nr:hypothetical protein [Aquibacillus saliphilus]
MVNINQLDPASLATIAAIVAALVTVVGNAFKLPSEYRSLLAIGVAFVLVFLPQGFLNKVLTALIIGLTASGVYSQVKPLKFLEKIERKNKKNNKQNEILNLSEKTGLVGKQNTGSKSDTKNNNSDGISAR